MDLYASGIDNAISVTVVEDGPILPSVTLAVRTRTSLRRWKEKGKAVKKIVQEFVKKPKGRSI